MLLSAILMAVTIGFMVMAIRRLIRNYRGWRRMEEDRKAKGMPLLCDMAEWEKEKYWIDD